MLSIQSFKVLIAMQKANPDVTLRDIMAFCPPHLLPKPPRAVKPKIDKPPRAVKPAVTVHVVLTSKSCKSLHRPNVPLAELVKQFGLQDGPIRTALHLSGCVKVQNLHNSKEHLLIGCTYYDPSWLDGGRKWPNRAASTFKSPTNWALSAKSLGFEPL